MATSKIQNEIHEIITNRQLATISANSRSVSVTLNVPSGYEFLTWMAVSSTGWVGYCYPTDYNTPSATVWTLSDASTSDRNIICWYQCYK